MTDINQVKNAILRKSFSSFVQKCFYELNPSETFIKGAYRLKIYLYIVFAHNHG